MELSVSWRAHFSLILHVLPVASALHQTSSACSPACQKFVQLQHARLFLLLRRAIGGALSIQVCNPLWRHRLGRSFAPVFSRWLVTKLVCRAYRSSCSLHNAGTSHPKLPSDPPPGHHGSNLTAHRVARENLRKRRARPWLRGGLYAVTRASRRRRARRMRHRGSASSECGVMTCSSSEAPPISSSAAGWRCSAPGNIYRRSLTKSAYK